MNENLEKCAYHEAGRVVFAYRNGYACNSMELSATDSGAGVSMLSGLEDSDLIHALLTGKYNLISAANNGRAIEVAKKLLAIYCAGACAEAYYANNRQIGPNMELELPSQDNGYVDRLQSFLSVNIPNHPADFVSRTMVSVLHQLSETETWKAIQQLALVAVKNGTNPLDRRDIEAVLTNTGFALKRRAAQQAFSIGLSEEDSNTPVTGTTSTNGSPVSQSYSTTPENQLDTVLKNFLNKIHSGWTEDELNASIIFLKKAFERYGKTD